MDKCLEILGKTTEQQVRSGFCPSTVVQNQGTPKTTVSFWFIPLHPPEEGTNFKKHTHLDPHSRHSLWENELFCRLFLESQLVPLNSYQS